MRIIRLFFKDTKNIVTTSLEEIAIECMGNPTEMGIMRTLKEMEHENEIAVMLPRKEY